MQYLISSCIVVAYIAVCFVILFAPLAIGISFLGIAWQIVLFIVGLILVIAFIFWTYDNYEDKIDNLF